jgi:ABC-type amino acid transport substrate-binding protein
VKTRAAGHIVAALVAVLSVWSAPAQAAEPVRMAFQEHFPPFVEIKDGKPTGQAVDIVRAAAARAGVDVDFVPVPFDQVHGTLKDGRADAIFPIAITPERESVYDFSAPLLMTGGAIFVRTPTPTPANLAALVGKTVVTPGTGPLVPYIQKNAPDLKLVITKNYEESLDRIVSGEAAAAALNFQVGAAPRRSPAHSRTGCRAHSTAVTSKSSRTLCIRPCGRLLGPVRRSSTWSGRQSTSRVT